MHLDGRQGSDQGSLVCPKCFNSLSCLDLVWIYSVFICFVEIHHYHKYIEYNQTLCKVKVTLRLGGVLLSRCCWYCYCVISKEMN